MLRSRTSRHALLGVLGALVAAASIAPAASAAAQRYSSPTGSGTACTSANPCALTQALSGAGGGDEVIVNPGDYSLTATPVFPSQITIHGVAGQPRPRLLFSGGNQIGMSLGQGTLLRYVDIVQAAPSKPALYSPAATLDQVVVKGSSGSTCTAIVLKDSTMRNSVVVAPGSGASAICAAAYSGVTSSSSYRNVTAVATGSGGVAIEAYALNSGSKAAVELVNVIAKGGPGGASLAMNTDSSSGAAATITASHTNWANYLTSGTNTDYVDGGGNQGTPPWFVAPAADDYHQRAGSATIDAGVNDPANGVLDVDGDPRATGTTDIGADEFVPPVAPTSPPEQTSTPPAQTSTPPAQTSTRQSSTASTQPTTPTFAGVRLMSTKLSFGDRFIALRLSCPAGTVGRCSGRTKLTTRRSHTTIALGSAGFSIAPGKQSNIQVRVPPAGRRLLGSVRRLRGKDSIAARNGMGQSKTTAATVTIRTRHR